MSWYVEGNLNVRDKVSEAQSNLDWLSENTHELSGSELYRIEEIKKAKIWKQAAFTYLAKLRMKYDEFYAQAKSLTVRMEETSRKLKDYELSKAQSKLNAQDNLLERIARLEDENYWLRVELSGKKQTSELIQRARSK